MTPANEQPNALPTVELIEDAYYWVKNRYSEHVARWTIARWSVGSFWGLSGGEISPSIISGPIPRPPAESSAGSRPEGAASVGALDEPLPSVAQEGE